MQSNTITDILNKSFERTILILFKTFSLKKWLFLLLIAFLAGEISLGANFSLPAPARPKPKEAEASMVQIEHLRQARMGVDGVLSALTKVFGSSLSQELTKAGIQVFNKFDFSKVDKITFALIAAIGILILSFLIIFSWVSARFKFVWYEAIVNNDASIAASFRKYAVCGDSLFLLYLLMMVLSLGFFLSIGIWIFKGAVAAGILNNTVQWSLGLILNVFIYPLIVLIIGIIILSIFGVLVNHYVIPIMAIDKCSASQGLKKFQQIFKDNVKYFIIFLGLAIAIGIIVGIVFLLATIIIGIALFMIGGLLFGASYLLFVIFLKSKLTFFVFLFIVGVPFAASAMALFASLNLPFAVFFRCFSLYYLSGLGCGYSPLALEAKNK